MAMTVDVFDVFLRLETALIAVTAWFLPVLFCRVFPDAKESRIYARLAPALPVLIAVGLVWLPGTVPAEIAGSSTGMRTLYGVAVGVACGYFYKAFLQTVLGRDARLKHRMASAPAPAPLPAPAPVIEPAPEPGDDQ